MRPSSFLALVLVALSLVVGAPAADAPAGAGGHRFVFLIDASTMMEPARKATEQAVEELIASGASGQMQAGDEFVLWPYRLKVLNDAFPPTRWSPTNAVALAKSSGDFLRGLKYEGAGLFYVALVEAFRVIKASPSVSVFLVSDGAEMLQGTPFDLYANTIYRQRATQLRREKKPFVTALLALDGNVIDCTVGVGGEALTIPAVPPEARPKPVIAPAPTPAPAPVPVITTAKPAPAPVAPATVTPTPKPTPPTTAKAGLKAAPVVQARPTPTPTVAPAPKPAPPSTATTVTPPPAPVVTKAPAPGPMKAEPVPAAALTPGPTPAPANVATTVEPAPAPGEPTATPEKPVAGIQLAALVGENRLLVIGAGLLLGAALIIWMLLRRQRAGRSHASLITQSMKR